MPPSICAGRDVGECDGAAGRREYLASVDGGADVAETADRHRRDFAAGAIRRLHAGDALQRFDHVVVRELADVFGDDRLDDLLALALDRECLRQTVADAGDDDFLDVAVGRIAGRRRRRACLRIVGGSHDTGIGRRRARRLWLIGRRADGARYRNGVVAVLRGAAVGHGQCHHGHRRAEK
jgi:hypothetical protein